MNRQPAASLMRLMALFAAILLATFVGIGPAALANDTGNQGTVKTAEVTPTPSPDVTPTPTPTPIPTGSELPGQGTPIPTGDVGGIVGTPPAGGEGAVTPPPTDTPASLRTPGDDGWRAVLVGIAALIGAAALLIKYPPTAARATARRRRR